MLLFRVLLCSTACQALAEGAAGSGSATTTADVVVIGGGWSGLVTARQLLAAGLEPLVLEARSDSIGGMFAYSDDPATPSLARYQACTSSKVAMEMSDFPFASSAAGAQGSVGDGAHFAAHTEARAHLVAYAERFDLLRRVRLGAAVAEVRAQGGGGGSGYVVVDQSGRVVVAARVVVATGVQHHDNGDLVRADARFAALNASAPGLLQHAAAFKKVGRRLLRQRVLVYGADEAGADAAAQLGGGIAARVHMSAGPRGVWLGDRFKMGIANGGARENLVAPADFWTSELGDLLDEAADGTPDAAAQPAALRAARHGRRQRRWEAGWGRWGHGIAAWEPKDAWGAAPVSASGTILRHTSLGQVVPVPDVRRCEPQGAAQARCTFADGATVEDIDLILLATGHEARYPFLKPLGLAEARLETDAYKLVFLDHGGDGGPHEDAAHEDAAGVPTLAFVGGARPVWGAATAVIEMQARLVAAAFSAGSADRPSPLPSRAARDAARAVDAARRERYFGRAGGAPDSWGGLAPPLVSSKHYMDGIAELLGAAPNFGRLFRRAPHLWWLALRAPLTAHRYRLNDDAAHAELRAKLSETCCSPSHAHVGQSLQAWQLMRQLGRGPAEAGQRALRKYMHSPEELATAWHAPLKDYKAANRGQEIAAQDFMPKFLGSGAFDEWHWSEHGHSELHLPVDVPHKGRWARAAVYLECSAQAAWGLLARPGGVSVFHPLVLRQRELPPPVHEPTVGLDGATPGFQRDTVFYHGGQRRLDRRLLRWYDGLSAARAAELGLAGPTDGTAFSALHGFDLHARVTTTALQFEPSFAAASEGDTVRHGVDFVSDKEVDGIQSRVDIKRVEWRVFGGAGAGGNLTRFEMRMSASLFESEAVMGENVAYLEQIMAGMQHTCRAGGEIVPVRPAQWGTTGLPGNAKKWAAERASLGAGGRGAEVGALGGVEAGASWFGAAASWFGAAGGGSRGGQQGGRG